MISYNPKNWFWFVGTDPSRVWSSAANAYLPVTDPAYQQWLAVAVRTPTVPTELDVTNILDKDNIVGPIILPKYVDREAYRRISTGFVFNGHPVQMRDELVNGVQKSDQINICAQAVLAHAAVAAGAQPGDYNWCADLQPFAWRDANNVNFPLDAQGMVDMSNQAAKWKRDNVWAASALKDINPIPRDFTANSYWP